MRAAVIDGFGGVPQCREVPDPEPSGGWEVATVRAAAIKNIERMLAAGTHYGSRQMTLPAQLGLDAVVELADGRRVYAGAAPPGAAMAEQMLVSPATTVDVPEGLDDADAAALPNPAASAWFALEYAGKIQPGQSVLILGGTGVTGGLAVQLAKRQFEAGHVVVVGRNAERLRALKDLGADETIGIAGGTDELGDAVADAHAKHPFDVVLDYVWGKPAELTLCALGNNDLAAAYHHTRFVQIGEAAGPTVELPAAVLRSAGVELVGQGAGSVPPEALGRVNTEIIPKLFDMLARGVIRMETLIRPLDEVGRAWADAAASGVRTVLVP